MNNICRAATACLLAACTLAHSAPNSLNEEFSGMSQDERGGRITRLMASMGQQCRAQEVSRAACPVHASLAPAPML